MVRPVGAAGIPAGPADEWMGSPFPPGGGRGEGPDQRAGLLMHLRHGETEGRLVGLGGLVEAAQLAHECSAEAWISSPVAGGS